MDALDDAYGLLTIILIAFSTVAVLAILLVPRDKRTKLWHWLMNKWAGL